MRVQRLTDVVEAFNQKQAELVTLLALVERAGLFDLGIAMTGDEHDEILDFRFWIVDCKSIRHRAGSLIIARTISNETNAHSLLKQAVVFRVLISPPLDLIGIGVILKFKYKLSIRNTSF